MKQSCMHPPTYKSTTAFIQVSEFVGMISPVHVAGLYIDLVKMALRELDFGAYCKQELKLVIKSLMATFADFFGM